RDDVDLVAIENIGPQIDVARLEMIVDETGRPREIESRLRDVVTRIVLNASSKLFALLSGRMWADEHAVTATFADSLDHQFVEIGEDMLPLCVIGQEKCLN